MSSAAEGEFRSPGHPLLLRLLRVVGIAVLTLFLASIVVFAVLRFVPGDPATVLAGADADDDTIAAIRAQLGLDRPVPAQYLHWIGALVTGDLGRAYVVGGDIAGLVGHALANTLVLAVGALVVALVITAVLSLAVVLFPRPWLVALVNGFQALSIAVPTFVTGVVLVSVFAVAVRLLPAGGTPPRGYLDDLSITAQYLILPSICLGLPVASALTRFLTEALRTELAEPYVTTARAAGVPERRIVLNGALRNALPPTVTVLGLQIGGLLGSAVLVEAIFAWPGLGQLLVQAINARDYPLVQVLLLLSVAVFIVTATLTELAQTLLDPAARAGVS
ncbi:ABC transporter permease [Gordonia soli]|uniref:Putative peptide ABC transporter permease protein n=1 Tax=Gordonia soli NBRC 108243 TaxID=1223545 RepID=M0QPZ0_9ACTN|nr:ABC transporter permease [Gordonia soli]GAC70444.1 putative peptide ABC transporter permease protein [Gordonia soli NBRC 108243]